MSVRLRLKRVGRCHHPSYRLTAVDRRKSCCSRVIEELGSYDPITREDDRKLILNHDRIAYWLSVGATPSDTVRRLLEKSGITKPAASS